MGAALHKTSTSFFPDLVFTVSREWSPGCCNAIHVSSFFGLKAFAVPRYYAIASVKTGIETRRVAYRRSCDLDAIIRELNFEVPSQILPGCAA